MGVAKKQYTDFELALRDWLAKTPVEREAHLNAKMENIRQVAKLVREQYASVPVGERTRYLREALDTMDDIATKAMRGQ